MGGSAPSSYTQQATALTLGDSTRQMSTRHPWGSSGPCWSPTGDLCWTSLGSRGGSSRGKLEGDGQTLHGGGIAFVHAQIEQEVGYPDEQVLAGKKGTSIAAKANSQMLSRKDTVLKLVPHRKAHAQRLERVKLLSWDTSTPWCHLQCLP